MIRLTTNSATLVTMYTAAALFSFPVARALAQSYSGAVPAASQVKKTNLHKLWKHKRQGAVQTIDAVIPNPTTSAAVPIPPPSTEQPGMVSASPTVTVPIPVPPVTSQPEAIPPGTKVFTLDQVLALALDANSSVRLAREKVLKAQQLIYEANAGGLPQVTASVVDSYSSNEVFGTSAGASSTSYTLPGGGTIPVITDTGGGNTGAVTSSGGGGTATSGSSLSNVGTNSTSSGGSGTSTSGTTPTNTSLGSSSTTDTGTAVSNIRSSSLSTSDLPPIMQNYAAALKPAVATQAVSKPRDTTGNGSTGNGTTGTGVDQTSLLNQNQGDHNNYNGHVSITQGIDMFQLVPAIQEVETTTRDFYITDLTRVQNETALSVKNQFFNVLRDQAQVSVYEQQVTADTESVRVTQAQVNAGSTAEYDLLTAQTTLSNAQQQLSSARNTLSLDKVNLNNLIGISPATPIALQEPPTPPLNQTFDTNKLTQTAFENRPELKQADQNILIAKRLIKLAGASLLPTLSIVGAENYNGNVGSGPNNSVSLSAVLGIPLYDGGTTHAKVKEAESDLRSQLITRDQLRQNVSVELLQALSNINNAQTQASSAAVGATQGQEALRLANVRYQNGIGTILDVVNASAQASQAQTNLLTAKYNYQTSLAQLTRAIGGR